MQLRELIILANLHHRATRVKWSEALWEALSRRHLRRCFDRHSFDGTLSMVLFQRHLLKSTFGDTLGGTLGVTHEGTREGTGCQTEHTLKIGAHSGQSSKRTLNDLRLGGLLSFFFVRGASAQASAQASFQASARLNRQPNRINFNCFLINSKSRRNALSLLVCVTWAG